MANHPDVFADSAFRDSQLEKLINDFSNQYGILVSNLRVQEMVGPDGLPHLILTCTYYIRSKIFMKKMGFKEMQKQIPEPVGQDMFVDIIRRDVHTLNIKLKITVKDL